MRSLLAVAFLAISGPGYAEESTDLHLVCLGAGSANKMAATNVYGSNSTGQSSWGQVLSQRTVPFDDQVNVEIDGDQGRIRLPRIILPPIRGGENGWFKLRNVKWEADNITATAGVNFMNSPKIYIDRVTGRISINGKAGDYSGECQPYNPANVERRF